MQGTIGEILARSADFRIWLTILCDSQDQNFATKLGLKILNHDL
jgi:hypothetical protein